MLTQAVAHSYAAVNPPDALAPASQGPGIALHCGVTRYLRRTTSH
jgi:hypothetical protein